jgi:hypothetical protein
MLGDQPIVRFAKELSATAAFAAWPVLNNKASTNKILNGFEQFLHAWPKAGSEIQRVARAVCHSPIRLSGSAPAALK